jgi:SAM-dependent methyltransferase
VPTYPFANARDGQVERLRALQALLDPGTVRHLEALGVAPGWRCLEVGGGAGSIAAWLAERVGAAGSVLATDLDTTVLAELALPNVEVRQHDLLADELPAGAFDLVHERLVLAWLPAPAEGAHRLARALRPGGVLLIEEMDFGSVCCADPLLGPVFERVVAAHNAVLASSHMFDPACGRQVEQLLRAAGLTDDPGFSFLSQVTMAAWASRR